MLQSPNMHKALASDRHGVVAAETRRYGDIFKSIKTQLKPRRLPLFKEKYCSIHFALVRFYIFKFLSVPAYNCTPFYIRKQTIHTSNV